MDSVRRAEFLAKPKVKAAVATIAEVLKEVVAGGTFAENEVAVLAVTGEAVRTVLEDGLQQLADGFGDVVLVEGIAFKRHEPGTVIVHSLCGPLRPRRFTFRQVGVHNGPTVDPMALAAGLVEGATPALAYSVAHGYAQHDMRAHVEALEAAERIAPPRATLERMAKRIAERADEIAPQVEPMLRRTEAVPEGACAVCLGLDRTAALMDENRPADAPPKPARKRRKPRVRRAPPPKDTNWRMAYVGTVSLVDAAGEQLLTRRYAAPACDDPNELMARMCADVEAAVRRAPHLDVGIVQDGAPEMWNVCRAGLERLVERGVISGWLEAIDRYHLLERLAAALVIVEPEPDARRARLEDWRARLDVDYSAIDKIEHFLLQRYDQIDPPKQPQLWEHLRYLQNNKDRMRYAALRCVGLPVGSGVTESAAKTVVGRRAKNAGQRWSEPGLRGVLTLRALHQSQRLPRFWTRFSRRYTREVQAA